MRYSRRMAGQHMCRWAVILGLGAGLAGPGCGDDGAAMTTGATATAGTTDPATTAGTDGADETATAGSETAEAARPNWHEDIAPFIAANCSSCHTEGSVAPFIMDDYEQTWPLAGAMLLQIDAATMPPWHAVETEECSPPAAFKHDARLSADQIEMMHQWVELGTPEGDPANAAPLPEPPSTDLSDPSSTTIMQGSITVEPQASQLDFFHCLSFDPGNDQDVFVDGVQVLPGNDAIVHHVLLYIDIEGESASWTNGQQMNCGGGAGGVGNVQLVGGWVPGTMPMEPPEGVGILLPAGARIIYNMHYHASVSGPQVDDATGIALRWTTNPPQQISQFSLIGAPGEGTLVDPPFFIPAGATGHVETIDYVVPDFGPVDLRVWSVLNHMHKVGVDMKVSVLRDGQEQCLIQTPRYDYNWQRIYEYAVGIDEAYAMQAGDVVRVRCTYDNTLDNPSVVEALDEVGLSEPQDVLLGEGTLDEMCLVGMGVSVGL